MQNEINMPLNEVIRQAYLIGRKDAQDSPNFPRDIDCRVDIIKRGIENQAKEIKRVYIAGPMSGYTNCNRDEFNNVAEQLKAKGLVVLNPATLPDGLTQAQYMDICFSMIRAADALLFLPQWQLSEGAQAEYHYAKKLKLKILKVFDTSDVVTDLLRRPA